MSTRSRHLSIQRRQRLANAKKMARINPDALVRNLLSFRKHLRTRQQRREMWQLLQNLGSDAVIKRAGATIRSTRSHEELEAVLRAASIDLWFECGSIIQKRFIREVERVSGANAPDLAGCLHMFAVAAARLGSPLPSASIEALIHHRSPRYRAIGAEAALLQQRAELLDDVLPLCWDRGDASFFACELAGRLGTETHAALIWPRILSARKAGRVNLFKALLAVMGSMGAFDIQIALRVWIEEDLAEPGSCLWNYGKVWSQLVAAKLAAGACNSEEALADLRWFVRIAGTHLVPPPTPGEGRRALPKVDSAAYHVARQGPLFIAQGLMALRAPDEAESLLRTFVQHGLPSPEQFPELRFPGLAALLPDDARKDRSAWLAAAGQKDAQTAMLQNWGDALREARFPEHWEIRGFLEQDAVLDVLRQSLRNDSAGCVREVLGLLMGDPIVEKLKPDLEALAATHTSAIIRWKTKRVLAFARRKKQTHESTTQRWLRMDAAVLAGVRHHSKKTQSASQKKPRMRVEQNFSKVAGLIPPSMPGAGFRLQLEGLSARQREATVKALVRGNLEQALARQLPSGPAIEERADIRAAVLPAAPNNEIDQRMMELAAAVMANWGDGEGPLTLDEDGVSQIAAGLSAEIQILEEDDLTACGAFIGEALRKRLGGRWNGFDEHYTLEIGDRVLDPIAWVFEVYERKDAVEGATLLAERYQTAVAELEKPHGVGKFHTDPSPAFQAAMTALYAMPLNTPMTELLAESRVLSYRLLEQEWPMVLAAMEPLIEPGSGVRAVAAVCVYAPGEVFARAWAHWGRELREGSGLQSALVDALEAAAELDDINALPNWTIQPQQGNFSFLNPLRKKMQVRAWRKVLLLLMRQRSLACDRNGTGWCLYSYKYEFPDCLTLVNLFCGMSVSARQTLIRATQHCTRDEQSLFRPLWAEALRDPAIPVVFAALDAINQNGARSLRPLIQALSKDSRADIAEAATRLLAVWQG